MSRLLFVSLRDVLQFLPWSVVYKLLFAGHGDCLYLIPNVLVSMTCHFSAVMCGYRLYLPHHGYCYSVKCLVGICVSLLAGGV